MITSSKRRATRRFAPRRKHLLPRSDKLIETLAAGLAAHLLQMFSIQKIEIELRKFVLPDVDYVSVTVTRTRPTD